MITITIDKWLLIALCIWYFIVNYIEFREGLLLFIKHIKGLF